MDGFNDIGGNLAKAGQITKYSDCIQCVIDVSLKNYRQIPRLRGATFGIFVGARENTKNKVRTCNAVNKLAARNTVCKGAARPQWLV